MSLLVLVGNPNCGKSTLFNALTGGRRRVGNFPGVTVDIGCGEVRGRAGCTVADLPGVYSLSAYSEEEAIAYDFLRGKKADVIVNVIDATCLRRGLYLTLQLAQLGLPMVVALNMMDQVSGKGLSIDTAAMSAELGFPVIPISAVAKRGIKELVECAQAIAQKGRGAQRQMNLHADLACRLPASATLYKRVDRCLDRCTKSVGGSSPRFTSAFDRVLLGRWTAFPVFAVIMWAVFYLTFSVLGPAGQRGVEWAVVGIASFVERLLVSTGVHPVMISLVMDGIFGGVGSVLSFFPVIMCLYFFLSLLEDSGYMARVAVLMDKPMSYIGLTGSSFVPLLLGFGCSVPAALACRTIKGKSQRWRTLLLIPYMSCSAKAPVFAMMSATFFPEFKGAVTALMYVIGVAFAVLAGRLTGAGGDGEGVFLLELPEYRAPRLGCVLGQVWHRAKDFIIRAFTFILLSSVSIRALCSFDGSFAPVSDVSDSILAEVCSALGGIFAPLGFGRWETLAALVCGIGAKETVVSTLTVLAGHEGVRSLFANSAAAFSFMLFSLLYTPCVAAMSALTRELGSVKKGVALAVFQSLVAYGVAGGFYLIFS